jgi:PAS domain S-box-containing protein
MLNEPHSPLLRYGSAVATVALALVLTSLLWPMIQPSIFPLFFAAVMVSAWYCGLGPGLLATALAVVVIDYFFLPPPSTRIITLDTFLRLGVFVLVALLISSLNAARRRAEEALRESELEFRSVTQSATDAIIAADSHGHILIWNKGAQTIFGYGEAEIVGKPLTLLMPARYRDAHCRGLERPRATGESHMIGKTIELYGLKKDGREFPLELSLASWQTGEGTFYSGIIRDLTARKRIEEALHRAHDELEMRVQERTTELARVNEALRAEISERKRAEEEKQKLLHDLGERVKELTVLHKTARLLQDEQRPTAEVLQEITALLPAAWQYPEVAAARILFDGLECTTPNFAPTPWTQQAEFTTPEGKPGVVEVVYAEERPPAAEGPFSAEERSLLNSLAEMLRSYFERWEAEARVAQVTGELIERNAELWRLQREMGRVEPLAALGRVTGTIAHELGTPLNSVLGYSQLLAQEALSDGARESLHIIESQVHRMIEIIQHYLSRTRRAPQRHHPINLNELVRETLTLLTPIFQQHRVQVTTVLAESLPLLSGDGASLQRVLINLLNNAVDALDEGGTVTVAARASAPPEAPRPGVVIEITDSGCGIPPELLPSIFDLFVTTKTPGKGTGLGLMVCQEIVKSHGGTIDLSSQVGQGTCVRIVLPTAEELSAAAPIERQG